MDRKGRSSVNIEIDPRVKTYLEIGRDRIRAATGHNYSVREIVSMCIVDSMRDLTRFTGKGAVGYEERITDPILKSKGVRR